MLAMTTRPHPVLAFAKTSLSLLKERDQRVRFAILHLVMLSAAKHPHRTGFLTIVRNDTKGMLAMTMRPHPVLAFAKTSLSLLKERDQRVRFAILHLVMLSEAKHPYNGFLTIVRNK